MQLKKIFRSVSIRLSLKFAVLLTISMMLVSVIFSLALEKIVRSQKNSELERAASMISQSIVNKEEKNIDAGFPSLPYYITYVVYSEEKDENGTQKVTSTNDPFLPLLPVTGDTAERYFKKDYFIDGDLNILYHSTLLNLDSGNLIIETAVNLDTDSTSKLAEEIPPLAVIIFFPVLIFSFLVSLFITKQTMKPVVKMTESAKKISSSNLEEHLPLSGKKDELDELASTFNNLFTQLQKDFTRERQFTSDVSHELKTPVAVISGQANLLRRWGKDDPVQLEKSLASIISETKSMEAIIQNLLQMSRLESGRVQPQIEKIDLLPMFLKIRDEVAVINGKAEIVFDDTKNISINADPELLHQVFIVVISNSLKFCPEPCVIKIDFESSGETTIIQLEDNGPGFGEKNIDHVFERFFRGDEAHTRSKGGSGLGLSIAKTIIESMNGTISAFAGKTGGAGIKIIL